MSLVYPIAADARAALSSETRVRNLTEARELAGGAIALVSEFLRPKPEEAAGLVALAERSLQHGFAQVYADAEGRPVIAVSYWKPGAEGQPVADMARNIVPAAAPGEDTTDDLYFAKPQFRQKRRRRAGADPNQMDLFSGPAEPDGE